MRKPIVRHTLLWVLGGIAMDRQVRYWCTRRYSEHEMVEYSIYNSTKTNSEGVRAVECPIYVFWLSSCLWVLLQTSQSYLEAHAFPRGLISACPPFNKWPLVHPSHISSSLMSSGSQPPWDLCQGQSLFSFTLWCLFGSTYNSCYNQT